MNIHKDTELRGQKLGDIVAQDCTVLLEDCVFNSFYALNCVVVVRRCQGINVGRNFVQLDKCRNSLVEWCQVVNAPGKTSVEDILNLYMTTDSVFRFNYVEGATPHAEYSGSGIMIDKGCARCIVSRNFVVDTQNVGIGIAGGAGNLVTRNMVVSSGPGCNGNVGIYIKNHYPEDKWKNNRGVRNQVAWLAKKIRNDWWVPDAAKWEGNIALSSPNKGPLFKKWKKLYQKQFGIE